MANQNLPVNTDTTYADSTQDPSVKTHQQHHDKIHQIVNWFDKDVAAADGYALVYNAATGLYRPVDISGGTGSVTPTDYATAAPSTLFLIRWAGGPWPASRPSGRANIYFLLQGAPEGTTNPTWMLPGDITIPAGMPLSTAQVTAIAQARVDAYAASNPGGGTGVTDHGALGGLADDDHPQYLNTARGDTRYYTKALADAANTQASTNDRNRANHFGTQQASSISDFATAVQAASASSTVTGQIGWYGDSIVLFGEGWPYYVAAMSSSAIRPVLTVSNAGMPSAGLASNVAAQVVAVNPRPQVVVFMAGANDAQSAVTLATYSANIIAVVNALKAAGITPILCTVTPNTNATFDANVRLYNAWIRNWAPANGVMMVDTHAAVAASGGGWITGMADADGLHPSPAGCKAMAAAFITAVSPSLPPRGSLLAFSSGTPNLFTNSAFLTDANADGQADGWFSTGLTPTYVTDATNGFKWARLTGSGTTLGKFNSPEVTTGYVAGTDRVRFAARVRSGQNTATAKAGLRIEVTCYTNAYAVTGNFLAVSPNGALSQQITDGVCSVEFVVPAGTTKIIASLSNGTFDNAAGVTGTYDMALPTLYNLTTLGIAAVAAGGGGGGQTSAAPAPAQAAGYLNSTFADEFTTLATVNTGTTADATKKWSNFIPFDAAGVMPGSCFTQGTWTDSAGSTSASVLHIVQNRWNYNQGLYTVDTRNASGFSQQYGYFEARICYPAQQVVTGNGVTVTNPATPQKAGVTDVPAAPCGWPSFWSLGRRHLMNNSSELVVNGVKRYLELDFHEYYDSAAQSPTFGNRLTGTVHDWPSAARPGESWRNTDGNQYGDYLGDPAAWHVYGCLWVPGKFTWYLDGVQQHSISYSAGAPPSPNNVTTGPGGTYVMPSGTYNVADLDTQGIVLSLGSGNGYPMHVDWVRVWGP